MVYLYFTTGTEELEFVTVLDVLRRAGIEVKTVSADVMTRYNTGAHRIPIITDIGIGEINDDECDMIIIPGGMTGVENLCAADMLSSQIRVLHEAGKPLAAICAGPIVLARQGVLKGRKATIYPGLEAEITGAGAEYVDDRVVVDGNIITSQGPGTAMEFAFAVVEFLEGRETADEVRKDMLVI